MNKLLAAVVAVCLGLVVAVALRGTADTEEASCAHGEESGSSGHAAHAHPDESHATGETTDPHHAHGGPTDGSGPRYSKRLEHYPVPDVVLTERSGERLTMQQTLDWDGPMMLNFIFTSCTDICPVMTATFSAVQNKLAAEQPRVRMISISIDPDYDSPRVLSDYAERFSIKEPWMFLTGDPSDIEAVQRAFQAYRGKKMNHAPLTFVRARPDEPWIRVEGFARASDLISEMNAQAAG